MTKQQLRRNSPGRPRSEAARLAVLTAAGKLLEESGLGAFTIEAVSELSGVAKTTIYRWWPSKGALAIESFLEVMAPRLAYPVKKSVAESIREQMHLLGRVFNGKAGLTMCGLIAEIQGDPKTLEVYLERYVAPRRAEAAKVLERGISTGELRPDLDIESAIDALYGPIYYRLLVKHGPLTKKWIDTFLDYVLTGICNKP
jgi:AcrR family transcriptional regulator